MDTYSGVLGDIGLITAVYRGLNVRVVEWLPFENDPAEEARRIVRHGLADVLEWLGEEVGPPPGPTHAFVSTPERAVYVSPALWDRLWSAYHPGRMLDETLGRRAA